MDAMGIAVQVLVAIAGMALYFLYRQLRTAKRPAPKAAPAAVAAVEPAPEMDKREQVDQMLAELNTALEELRAKPAAAAAVPAAGVARSSHLREEILRLASQGVDAGQIAGRLLVPLAEAELLVRVSQLCQAYARESAAGART